MRKALIIFGKSLLALLSLAGVALLWFTGWLIWHYEYGIGLPDKDKLAAVSETGPACSVSDQRTYIALSEIPALVRQAVIASDEPDFYERLSANPFIEHTLCLALQPASPAGDDIAICCPLLDVLESRLLQRTKSRIANRPSRSHGSRRHGLVSRPYPRDLLE